MKQIRLLLVGLAIALALVGCARQTEELSPSTEPTHTLPPSESVPPPSTEPPTPTPTPSPPPVEEEGEYFDNALFVGDSIMEGIRQYVAAQRQEGEMLGTAKFLTSTMGVSLADLVGDRELGVGFTYQGAEKSLEDIVVEIAPRRVFLLLGLNDLASDPNVVVADIVERYSRLISNLQAASPGTEFIIITNPPKVASQWLPDYTANRKFGNQLIDEFVTALTQMCQEHSVPYVDAYESLKDENGAFFLAFSSSPTITSKSSVCRFASYLDRPFNRAM